VKVQTDLSGGVAGEPVLCTSVLRHHGACHMCEKYRQAWRRGEENRLRCGFRIKPEAGKLLGLKRRLLNQLRQVNRALQTFSGKKHAMRFAPFESVAASPSGLRDEVSELPVREHGPRRVYREVHVHGLSPGLL